MSALESIGRYAFSVKGLEITICSCSDSERTPNSPEIPGAGARIYGYQDLVDIFGQNVSGKYMLRFLTLLECGERVQSSDTCDYQSSYVGNGQYPGSYLMGPT